MSAGCYVYLLRAGTYAKIGIADDIQRRVAQLQTACPERITVESFKWVCCRTHALQVEANLHHWPTQIGDHTSGEWFRGGVLIESHFETSFGHRVSICNDTNTAAEMARRCAGMPMTMHHWSECSTIDMFPMGADGAHLAAPSDWSDGSAWGYAWSFDGPDLEYQIVGWYRRSGNMVLIVGFDGTWSETDAGRWYKAFKDHESVARNATELDSRFLLTDGRRR